MSKNNSQEILCQAGNICCRYALRKLSVGVASVLIGTTMYVGLVHADTVSSSNEPVRIAQASALTMAQQSSNSVKISDMNNVVTSSGKQFQQAALASSSDKVVNNVNRDSVDRSSNSSSSAYHGNNQQNQENVFNVSNGANQNNVVGDQLKVSLQQDNNHASVQQIDLQYNGKTVSNGSSLNYQLDSAYTYGISSQFTLTPDQLSKKQVIHLARISFQSSGNYQPGVLARSGSLVLNGQSIGSVSVQVPNTPAGLNLFSYQHQPYFDIIAMVDSPVEVQGNQILSVLYPNLFALGYNQSGFRGMPKSGSNVIMNIVTDKGIARNYVLNCKWAPVVAINDSSKYIAPFWGVGDDQSQVLGILGNNYGFESDSDRIAYYQAHGKLASRMNVDEPIQIGLHVYGTQGSSLLLDMSSSVIGFTPFVSTADSNGDVSTELLQTYYAGSHYVLKRQFEDDLSVRQLANKNYYGFAFSRQSDGSYNIYMNVTPKVYQLSSTEMSNSFNVATLRDYSTVVNCDSDPDKAFQMTQTAISNLDNIPLEFQSGIWFSFVDPTRVNYYTVDQIDPISGQVLRSASSHSYVNTVSISGQSTVKLHVISTSGVDLASVKSFTDWPNQNKHAALSIPSITGYELVSNPQAVLSALHLSGTAISSFVQVDYPAENTVADYYVVLQPKPESASIQIVDADESNKVLATGTVSGRFGEQIVSSADVQSKLDALIKTGHYTLASNGFDNGADYKDGTNLVTISLKHKLDSTQRHYRVIEDLPDGTKKVIIDMEATLYKDANTDKWQPDAAYLDGDFTKKVLMSDIYKLNVGQQADDGLPDFLKADIDKVSGYVWNLVDGTAGYQDGLFVGFYNSDEKNAGEVYMDLFDGSAKELDGANNVASILPSRDFHITYSRRSYPVTVNYYDLSGVLISSSKSQQLFADSFDVVPSIPANYVLAPGQSLHLNVSYNTSDNQLDLIIVPRVTVSTDSRTVTRTIKVQTPDGQTNNVVQTVKFVRNGYLNQVTKQTTYSQWSFNGQYQFSSYQPKPIDGYTVEVAPAVVVTPDSFDTMLSLAYHKQATVYSVDYELVNRAVVKSVSVIPGNDGTIHLTAPQGYRLLTSVTDVQVDHRGQKLAVLVVPDEQTYTSKDTLPSTVTEPLTKTVTRTVEITMPNGHIRTIKQSVKFERTATVNADGRVSYINWQAIGRAQFNRMFVPKRFGYQLSGQADKVAVTADMTDSVVEIKYSKN